MDNFFTQVQVDESAESKPHFIAIIKRHKNYHKFRGESDAKVFRISAQSITQVFLGEHQRESLLSLIGSWHYARYVINIHPTSLPVLFIPKIFMQIAFTK